MPYGSSDGKDVSLVFSLIVPEGNNLLYLKLISRISMLCNDGKMRKSLVEAESPEKIIGLINL
jgi:Phosphotransferase system mannitol/fructose-specific IIA domain (Ntr-type)